MKCPKYIAEHLKKQTKAARVWSDSNYIVSKWCQDHGIELETEDSFGGVEGIVNPEESMERILEAIRQGGEEREPETD